MTSGIAKECQQHHFSFFFFFFFAVLMFELKAFTLSHSTTSIFVMVFFSIRSGELFA
jgi:hypothetical protein